ncbi:hypothetical protein [Humidisolicoccus flavus]|uniref:hypothetical protein n=1 Tax=Humidisolicoccus flavus TaxID=3111414 RepID=UPI003246550A
MTAELLQAFGMSAEVTIDVIEQDEQRAKLFVTDVDGGDCGTVVLERTLTQWMITEDSAGCST